MHRLTTALLAAAAILGVLTPAASADDGPLSHLIDVNVATDSPERNGLVVLP